MPNIYTDEAASHFLALLHCKTLLCCHRNGYIHFVHGILNLIFVSQNLIEWMDSNITFIATPLKQFFESICYILNWILVVSNCLKSLEFQHFLI